MPPAMPVHEDRASFRALDAWPGIGFGLLYLLTLSRTLSVTHDSALFLRPIETLRPALVPNHLWFEPIMASAYQLLTLVWPDIGAQRASEAVNALAGAMALQAAYAIAVWRVGLTRRQAALTVVCAGFTYGVWYYSIAIETYALPLALTAWMFYGITARATRWPVVLACAVGHSVAILCHQSAVLFGAVALGALLSDGGPWRSRLTRASAYVVVCVLIVGGAYATAVISTGHGQSVARAVRWSTGHLSRRNFWSRPPQAFVHAAAGATRAMVGGQFVFAVPSLATRMDRWFPRNDPVDERFSVRTVDPPLGWLFAGLSIIALTSMGALMIMAAWTIWMNGFRVGGRVTALLAVWLAMYGGFFTFWDPANPDFWVVQVYLAPLVAMAVLKRATPAAVRPARVQTALFLVLGSSLLAVNGLSTVRLARNPANDYYAVYLRSVARELKAGDVLILGDHWPIRTHLERLPADAVFLSVEITRLSSAALAEKVRRLVDAGRRVFVAPDVIEVSPVTRVSYGPRYVAYVQGLRGIVCGLGPPRGGHDEMPLREVTCFDGQVVWSTSSR
jgi:hypothetical protein